MASKKQAKAAPSDDAAVRRHAAAWACIVRTLNRLAGAEEFICGRAPGAQRFVRALAEICEDIGANLPADSFDEAMKKLKQGFPRETKRRQDETRTSAKQWVQSEWEKHCVDYGRNKSAFARDYAGRLRNELGVAVNDRQIANRWLKE